MSATTQPPPSRAVLGLWVVLALGVSVPALRDCRPAPRPTPPGIEPTPSPTPSSRPTSASPVVPCPKLSRPTQCAATGPSYLEEVTAAVAGALELEVGSGERFDAAQQKAATLRVMQALEAKGFCTSYDLHAGNSGLASELGVRVAGEAATFADWYHLFASEGYVRWRGMYRTTCRPAADEEQLADVRAHWAPAVAPRRCPLQVDEAHPLRVKVDVRRGASGAVWLDATYEYFHGEGEGRAPLGPCGRRWCDLGVDGGPDGVVCADELAGNPVFTSLDSGLELVPGFQENAYLAQAFVTGGETARARVCSSKQPSVCLEVTVR